MTTTASSSNSLGTTTDGISDRVAPATTSNQVRTNSNSIMMKQNNYSFSDFLFPHSTVDNADLAMIAGSNKSNPLPKDRSKASSPTNLFVSPGGERRFTY